MFNEREVCRQVIEACCELEWPRDALMVQVLDDSTDEVARERIQDAVASWREKGVNVTYKWRSNRQGYKARGHWYRAVLVRARGGLTPTPLCHLALLPCTGWRHG